MPRKLVEPPRAVFTPRTINISELEKPKRAVNQDWVADIDAVEARVKHFISLDLDKLRTICDDEKDLERLCFVLELEMPPGEEGPDKEFSTFDFPEVHPSSKAIKKRELKPELETISEKIIEEESEPKSSSDSNLNGDNYRRTFFGSVLERATEKPGHICPYLTDLSVEGNNAVEHKVLETPPSVSSRNESVETIGYLSEDLFVNPAASQNTELLEPLDDARSPYLKFFSRPQKEIREHVERLRKKKFNTRSEKAIEEFVKYLDEAGLRSQRITPATLANLFTLEVESPMERSFCLDPVEMSYVPKDIAKLFDDPHSSTRAALHQQIMWDMLYEKGKPRKVAFGKTLPKVRKPWNKNTRERWFLPSDVSWDEISGKDFWKDLLHTEILEDFGKWLLDNPNYDKPEYLVNIGFFDYLKEKMANETEPLAMPVSDEEQFAKIIKKAQKPLDLVADEDKYKKLPRYEELMEASLHRVVTQEGIKVFEGR